MINYQNNNKDLTIFYIKNRIKNINLIQFQGDVETMEQSLPMFPEVGQ